MKSITKESETKQKGGLLASGKSRVDSQHAWWLRSYV